ncbi:PucR family transcriptional regulator [Paeniglutamicibacter psychrophenolicus]|uniref:Purine catabolism regulator n=1 Tax=Paeniglutamicibacter psychrophenolicus TaxID=257454 RepID=A0ABS4WJ79_9MICC|nr:PucR family transcriptional regulator ligand-binding domain-containing protein [Paeniglutamicibacter psychrophenolicus]MBP2376265.1 purine catabolism regulator [Paeniglutamicibacter psychrophenolicus]
MLLNLNDVLATPLFIKAHPRIMAGAENAATNLVRWVHSSEVLEIAPLLRGEELLLSGGQNLLALRVEAQVQYIQSLAERKVAALVIDTVGLNRSLSPALIEAAETDGLPLIELRATVPFVELAETINRAIVSAQALALQRADEVSQRLAHRIATSGPGLPPLVALIAQNLNVNALLVDMGGNILASSRDIPDDRIKMKVVSDIFLSDLVAARLQLESRHPAERELLSTVAERLGSILALALSQHHRPTRSQIADAALTQAIIRDASANDIRELCGQVGLDAAVPVAVLVIRGVELGRVRSAVERILRRNSPDIKTYLDSEYLYGVIPLKGVSPRKERRRILLGLREEIETVAVQGIMGPWVPDATHGQWSLQQALLTERLALPMPNSGALRDCEDVALERLCERELGPRKIARYIQELLSDLLLHDSMRSGDLVATLDVWLSSGCNSTAAAAALFMERQTLHKRLNKIFDLLGGDPRGTSRLAAIHLATRLALANLGTRK